MEDQNIQPFVLESVDSGNDHPNDNGTNAKLKLFRIVYEYTVSWFPIELNQPEQEYYFPLNVERGYRTKSEILLGELFQYRID